MFPRRQAQQRPAVIVRIGLGEINEIGLAEDIDVSMGDGRTARFR